MANDAEEPRGTRVAMPPRRRNFLGVALWASFVALGACSTAGDPIEPITCNCPATGVWPLVAIELPCNEGDIIPVVSLTGVCAGTAGVSGNQLVFGASTGGTCVVSITYPDTGQVEFQAQSLACGSDPTGCGTQVTPVGLSTPPTSTLPVVELGPQCAADAGRPADAAAD